MGDAGDEKMMPAPTLLEPSHGILIEYPMLTKANYGLWAVNMKSILCALDMWKAIEGDAPMEEEGKDHGALAAISQAVPDAVMMAIAEKKSAKEAWEAIRQMSVGEAGVRKARARGLKRQFDRMIMEDASNSVLLRNCSAPFQIDILQPNVSGSSKQKILWAGNRNDDEPALLMLETREVKTTKATNKNDIQLHLGVDENRWYLDSGASSHMTGCRKLFTNLDTSFRGTVKLPDGSRASICGRGTVLFKGRTGEHRAFTGVYYVPKLTVNAISLGRLEEDGCRVVMAEGFLRVFDHKGQLLICGERANNRLYTVNLVSAQAIGRSDDASRLDCRGGGGGVLEPPEVTRERVILLLSFCFFIAFFDGRE